MSKQAQKLPEHSHAVQRTRTDEAGLVPDRAQPLDPGAILQRAALAPESLRPADILRLQQTLGNRAVGQLLSQLSPMRSLVQRDCGCGGTCADWRSKQLESSPVPSVVNEVLSSPGQPLDVSTRALMEPRFGRDFQHVRIHTGPKASESAKAVSALAYTVGQNIVFAAGKYNPASHEGQHLLAHELAHTVQQAGASPGAISGITQPGDVSEREAEGVADQVMRMPGLGSGAPSIAEVPGARLERVCTQCAEEDNEAPRAEAAQNSETEGEEVHRDYPPVRPPAEALAEAEEREPLSPAVRSPGVIQRMHATGPVATGASPATLAAATIDVQPRAGAVGVLQRWSVDGPSDPAKNTIVCDGSGGIRVQIGTANDPDAFKCVGDCITWHEASHRADALTADPRVCKRWYRSDYKDGSQLNFGRGEQKPSEIKASQVEIACLNVKLPTASAKCKPVVEARITQMEAYRDSFK